MTSEQISHYRGLLANSVSTRAQLAEQRGDWQQFRFLCGWNAGLDQALKMLDRAKAFDPAARRERHAVTYAEPFGPHRCTAINADGEWTTATTEDT